MSKRFEDWFQKKNLQESLTLHETTIYEAFFFVFIFKYKNIIINGCIEEIQMSRLVFGSWTGIWPYSLFRRYGTATISLIYVVRRIKWKKKRKKRGNCISFMTQYVIRIVLLCVNRSIRISVIKFISLSSRLILIMCCWIQQSFPTKYSCAGIMDISSYVVNKQSIIVVSV